MGRKSDKVHHFDYLKLDDSDDGYAYVLVLVDDASSFVSLQPAASCTCEVAARSILEWVSVLGTPEVFVSDGAPRFKNETLKLVAAKLEASHRVRWHTRREQWYCKANELGGGSDVSSGC